MTLVFLFPGQTSRSPAMIERALERSSGARGILQRASDALGLDLERALGGKDAFSSTFVEVGCGTALTNVLKRRRQATCLAVDELSDTQIADLREPGVTPELPAKEWRQHVRA